MNSKGILAIKDTKNLCYKCLKKKDKIKKSISKVEDMGVILIILVQVFNFAMLVIRNLQEINLFGT